MQQDKDKIVESHKTVRHLVEVVVTPDHEQRKESSQFKHSKQRLREDGHYHCYICGCTENLQVHHYGGEWSLANDTDLNLLKDFLEEWDVYGYGKLLKNVPLESVDDIRNCMVLCQEHHTGGQADGSANGIHNITFPAWISQKIALKGHHPVPEEDATLAKKK